MTTYQFKGKDGPTSVYIAKNSKHFTLKQCLHKLKYNWKKKRIEKFISAKDHHSMEEVLAYAIEQCGLRDLDQDDIEVREEYEQLRASFIFHYQPELLGEYARLPRLESQEPEALMQHMQKVKEQMQHAKDIPKELFDIDFHKLKGQCRNQDESFFVLIETKYGYIGGSAVGDDAIKRLNKIMVSLYQYYGVTQEDIDNRTERYRTLVSELCR